MVLAILVAAPAIARATPNFPNALATHLDLAEAPACTLCHDGPTQRGTVTTPFGTSMRARGLQAYDEMSLQNALDALSGEKTDSDGDGTSDVDELQKGSDPNVPEGGSADGGPVAIPITAEYGCSVPRGEGPQSTAVMFLLLAVVLLTRRGVR
ncbi:Hypothetical protein A7982_06949 [Minicystis rosea]|nr:Hypothetical protein A7982_06949 [Minicystis rosea]